MANTTRSNTLPNVERKNTRIITAAIDFGTTFSGYAYGFSADLKQDPPLIITNNWNDGTRVSSKSPTTVLFTPSKTFHSFGFEAEEKYAILTESGEHKAWFYFRRFKMTLHSTGNLSRTTKLNDELGKQMKAMDVFSAAINFMKEHLMKVIKQRITTATDNDVQWVLTVPAIWSDPAKQFMREAAQEAGMGEDQLIIALEPEAASVYCQKVATERSVFPDGARLTITEPGSKFIILDLGGGTADVTALEKLTTDTLRQIHKASGGAWGGTKVDECFHEFLVDIFGGVSVGRRVIERMKNEHMEEYIDIMRDFELRKRDEKITKNAKLSIRIPTTLVELVEAENGRPIKEVLQSSRYASSVSKPTDKLRIDSATFATFFSAPIESVVNHFKAIFKEDGVHGIDTIIMVGGFSASALMQKAMKDSFPNKKIIIPEEPDLSVLKGAVVFGFNPRSISSRVARFTYGVDVVGGFFGIPLIRNCFLVLVESGKSVQVGEASKPTQVYPGSADQTSANVEIYVSPEKNPKYTTEPGCQRLGEFEVLMPDTTGGRSRKISLRVYFAGTELEVEAEDETTKRKFKTRVNFLG